jgi:hypothetical protein
MVSITNMSYISLSKLWRLCGHLWVQFEDRVSIVSISKPTKVPIDGQILPFNLSFVLPNLALEMPPCNNKKIKIPINSIVFPKF